MEKSSVIGGLMDGRKSVNQKHLNFKQIIPRLLPNIVAWSKIVSRVLTNRLYTVFVGFFFLFLFAKHKSSQYTPSDKPEPTVLFGACLYYNGYNGTTSHVA